jgi:hypothetical protein
MPDFSQWLGQQGAQNAASQTTQGQGTALQMQPNFQQWVQQRATQYGVPNVTQRTGQNYASLFGGRGLAGGVLGGNVNGGGNSLGFKPLDEQGITDFLGKWREQMVTNMGQSDPRYKAMLGQQTNLTNAYNAASQADPRRKTVGVGVYQPGQNAFAALSKHQTAIEDYKRNALAGREQQLRGLLASGGVLTPEMFSSGLLSFGR